MCIAREERKRAYIKTRKKKKKSQISLHFNALEITPSINKSRGQHSSYSNESVSPPLFHRKHSTNVGSRIPRPSLRVDIPSCHEETGHEDGKKEEEERAFPPSYRHRHLSSTRNRNENANVTRQIPIAKEEGARGRGGSIGRSTRGIVGARLGGGGGRRTRLHFYRGMRVECNGPCADYEPGYSFYRQIRSLVL